MEPYVVEIDQAEDGLVVLTVPALRLLVLGPTLNEAVARVRAALAFRLQEAGRRSEPMLCMGGQVVGTSPSPTSLMTSSAA